MSKAIVSSPGLVLASRMAWRSDPAPESLVLVTVKGAAPREEFARRNAKTNGNRRIGPPVAIEGPSGRNAWKLRRGDHRWPCGLMSASQGPSRPGGQGAHAKSTR